MSNVENSSPELDPRAYMFSLRDHDALAVRYTRMTHFQHGTLMADDFPGLFAV